jgi:hypothetical protein
VSEIIELKIRPGMSEARDSRMLPTKPDPDGGMQVTPRVIQNLRFRQLDRAEKRPGTSARSTSGLPSTGTSLWMRSWNGLDAVCIEDTIDSPGQLARTLYVRSGSGRWDPAGRTTCVVPERRTGLTMDDGMVAGAGITGLTAVAIDGVVYAAWTETAGTAHICAMDPGGTILRDSTLTSAGAPRLVYDGTTLYIVYRNGGNVHVRSINTGSLATSGATTIGAAVGAMDVAPMEGAATWLIAYPETATEIRVRVMTGTTSTHSATITTTSQATFVSVAGQSGNKVMVPYVDGTAAEVTSFSDTLTGANNATLQTAAGNEVWTCQSGIVRTGSNEWHVIYGGTDQSASPAIQVWMMYHARISGTPAATDGPYKTFRFLPCSKPFPTGASGTRRVSVVAHDADTAGFTVQSSHVILDLETLSTSAVTQHLSAISYEHQPWFSSNTKATNPEVASLGSGRYVCPIVWFEPTGSSANAAIGGVDALVFRSAASSDSMAWANRTTAEVGGAMLVSGGALVEHCGSGFSLQGFAIENGFANDPVTQVLAAAGGSLTADQVYSYKVVYVWLDPLGNRVHQSAPSPADTVTPSGGNLTVTVRVACLGCSGRFSTSSGVVIAKVYRSWDGGPYYNVGNTTSVVGSALSVTYTDAAADTTVEAFEPLYTDGGLLPNDPPSGARLIAVGGSRVFTVGWKERVVECSKQLRSDTPAEFSDSATLRITHREPLTALGWMDGTLVAFSANTIYVTVGDGPNGQGQGQQFSDPRQLPATVGADSPHVVEVHQGLIFKGAGTLWLLPRGFGPPLPVGDDIQETLGSFPYLRSAFRCANADDDCTHFVLAAADTAAAATKVAIWDNRLGGWSLDDVDGKVGAAGEVNGKFTWFLPTWDTTADLPTRQFSAATTEDLTADGAASWIESRVGFGTFHPFGVFGIGTVRSMSLFGEIAGSCVVKLDTSYDHASASTATITRGTTGACYLQHQLETRTRSAFRFDWYDAENSGKTAGLVLHSIALEVDKLPGPKPINPNQDRF